MQFLPDLFSQNSVSALGGVALKGGSHSAGKNAGLGMGEGKGKVSLPKANAFLDSLNSELAASGLTPIVDSSLANALPKGFRTIKRDASVKLDSEDVTLITNKLKKRGVKESALAGIEGLLSSNTPPTIGNIMGSIAKKGRTSEPLNDEERLTLRTALQKLQLPQDDMDEVEVLMDEGRGHEALRIINKAVSNLDKSGLTLEKNEIRALTRGLDLSEETRTKIHTLLGADNEESVNGASLDKLLAPVMQDFAEAQSETEKLSASLKAVIDEVLQAKKVHDAITPVADMRGSKKSDRAETRMRDDLTAKSNGFGREGQAEALNRLEEQEEALADEESAHQNRDNASDKQNAADQRRVAGADTKESAADKITIKGEAPPPQAREGFASALGKMDAASGMTMPVQNQVQNQAQSAPQSTSTAYANRQEIFSQVEQGMLRQLQDGSRQITIRLDPAELGHISLILSVKGGEVRAVIRAENAETTAALSEQMTQLRTSLEEQGLKVAELSVETQLPQDTTNGNQWTDTTHFNQEQQMREQARFLRLAKLRRESGATLAQDVQSLGIREEISQSGLHIIA